MFGLGEEKKSKNDNPEVVEKKPEAVERDEAIEGAKKESEMREEKGPDHCHTLMGAEYKLNLLEISHRTIEEIEKARFRIMAKHDGEESVAKFKDFIFNKLLNGGK